MKWDEILKLVIPLAIAISASLVGGDKMSNAKIAKHDDAIIQMEKAMIELKADMRILEYKIKHDGE